MVVIQVKHLWRRREDLQELGILRRGCRLRCRFLDANVVGTLLEVKLIRLLPLSWSRDTSRHRCYNGHILACTREHRDVTSTIHDAGVDVMCVPSHIQARPFKALLNVGSSLDTVQFRTSPLKVDVLRP
jgi:hypothetical protein